VGVNDAGLVAALLNRTAGPVVAAGDPPLRSRGLVIPQLLNGRSVSEALQIVGGLVPAQFHPFCVVLVERMTAGVVTSDGLSLSAETLSLVGPLMFTSSGLGDATVFAPRRRLFERLVLRNERISSQAQDRFHAHQWRSRRDVSVLMERSDARTVSRTAIAVTSRAMTLDYESLGAVEQRTDTAA
jgi:hypothetical protein